MFCRKCGEEIDNESVICPKCGCYAAEGKQSFCIKCGNKVEEDTLICTKCGCGTFNYINSNAQKQEPTKNSNTNSNSDTYPNSNTHSNSTQVYQSSKITAAKVFIILSMVFGIFLFFIPLIVGAIALDKINQAKCARDLGSMPVLTLIFCSVVAGILLLTANDADFCQN